MSQSAVYPVMLELDAPLEVANWRPLVSWLLAIPHFVVLYALNIVLGLFGLISWFAILFTGQWPQGLRDLVVGTLRWQMRVNAYMYLLTDVYPPFSLS